MDPLLRWGKNRQASHLIRKRGQEPLPERPEGCFAQRFLTPFPRRAKTIGSGKMELFVTLTLPPDVATPTTWGSAAA